MDREIDKYDERGIVRFKSLSLGGGYINVYCTILATFLWKFYNKMIAHYTSQSLDRLIKDM